MTKEQKQFYTMEMFKKLKENMEHLDHEISTYFKWLITYDHEYTMPRVMVELTDLDRGCVITLEPALPDICYVTISQGCEMRTEEMSILNKIFLKCRSIAASVYEDYERERGWL